MTLAACGPPGIKEAPALPETGAVVHLNGSGGGERPPSDEGAKPKPTAPVIISGGSGVVQDTGAETGEPETPASGDITLSFADTDVHEVVRAVLGDVLHLNYTIDPKVQASITVQTSRPLRREDVLPVLQEVLHASGLALIHAGNIYRILPNDEAARSGSSSVVVGSRRAPVSSTALPSYDIRVLPLRYVSAAELVQTLQPFLPKGTAIEADATRNLLIVSGIETDLVTVVDLVATFDVDWLSGMSYGIFTLQSATPRSVLNDLNEIFGSKEGTALGGVVRFVSLERLGAILVISPQRQYIVRVGQWIQRLDVEADETTPRIFEYRVQNSRAADLAKVLSGLFSSGQVQTVGGATAPGTTPTTLGGGGAYGASPSLGAGSLGAGGLPGAGAGGIGLGGTTPGATPGATTGGLGGLGGLGTPPATGNAGLPQLGTTPAPQPAPSGGQATSGTQTAENALPGSEATATENGGQEGLPRVRIVADEKNNALIIYATPRVYRMILDTVRKLDIVPLQVLIEATIAEVTLNDNLQYGVSWFFKNSGSQFANLSNTAGTGAISIPGGLLGGFNYAFTLPNGAAQIVVNALTAVTNVRVISSPQLLVLDNHTATLQVGDEVPVPTAQIQSTISAGAPVVNTIQYVDTGVILQVAPRVNANGVISLDISQEVSAATQTSTSSLNGPTIQQRRVLSSVSVQDGETIALGGLIQDTATLGNTGVPVLSNLPVLGTIFGNKVDNRVRTELLILLSPHVIHNAGEARQVTDELREQMRLVRPLVVKPEK